MATVDKHNEDMRGWAESIGLNPHVVVRGSISIVYAHKDQTVDIEWEEIVFDEEGKVMWTKEDGLQILTRTCKKQNVQSFYDWLRENR